MEAWLSFLGRAGYLPHGVCIAWSPGLLWSMVTADLAIAGAYFSIPLAIGHFARHRDLGPMRWVAWLFSAFIDSDNPAGLGWLNVYWLLAGISAAVALVVKTTSLDESAARRDVTPSSDFEVEIEVDAGSSPVVRSKPTAW